jgi:hypothetical protein
MAPRKTLSAVAPKRHAIKRGAPFKKKDQRADTTKRDSSANSTRMRNNMTIADGQHRMSVIRLFLESLLRSAVDSPTAPSARLPGVTYH